MTLPESSWVRYIDVLSAISDTAGKKFTAYLNTHEIDSQAGRKAAIDYAVALAEKYGESAAAMACEMYDATAAASGAFLPEAEPAAAATYGDVAKTVNGMAKQRQSNDNMGAALGRLVKRTGVDTTMKNAIRDGAEWAWVPHGDTCAFCIMLASNGWQRASKKALKGGHAEHIHSNCDCTYAVRFDGKSTVAGYDPDKYREMYENADGDTWQEKLNSMRREQYAEDGDRIRAQKRAAYERRKRLSTTESNDKMALSKDETTFRLSSHNLHNSTDIQFELAKNVLPIDGYDDVFLHGDPFGVSTQNSDGQEFNLSGSDFIGILNSIDFENGAIRLCACSTGKLDNGFASFVAREMNMDVMAPTTDVWLYPQDPKTGISEMSLYDDDGEGKPDKDKPGRWRVFHPDGSISEVKS